MSKKFYSVKEVAAILGVSKSLIYAGVQQGKIPHRRIMCNAINLSDAVIKAHRINITAISLKESITS